jgi:hypothetical protein
VPTVTFPTDFEELAALTEKEVLQRHFFHHLTELELGELVADAVFSSFSTIAALVLRLLKSHRPYFMVTFPRSLSVASNSIYQRALTRFSNLAAPSSSL